MKWIFALCFALFLWPAPTHAAPDPLSCSGYAEPRVFLESQAWWQVTPGSGGDEDFGRVSTALCFPLKQKVSGIVPLDIYLSLHDSPGTITGLAVQISPDGSGSYIAAKAKLNYRCSGDCTWFVHVDADTSRLGVDGFHEWRIRPTMAFKGETDRLVGSTSWQAYTDNGGRPVRNYRNPDYIQGKAWYTSMDYAQARISDGYTPGAVVSGKWSLALACDASSKPVTGCLVAIDPGPHMTGINAPLIRRQSAYNGWVTIDTTQLTNGEHRLAVQTDVASVKQGSTMTGVLIVSFEVKN